MTDLDKAQIEELLLKEAIHAAAKATNDQDGIVVTSSAKRLLLQVYTVC